MKKYFKGCQSQANMQHNCFNLYFTSKKLRPKQTKKDAFDLFPTLLFSHWNKNLSQSYMRYLVLKKTKLVINFLTVHYFKLDHNTIVKSKFKLGVVHKWRHIILDNFWPPPPPHRHVFYCKGLYTIGTKYLTFSPQKNVTPFKDDHLAINNICSRSIESDSTRF